MLVNKSDKENIAIKVGIKVTNEKENEKKSEIFFCDSIMENVAYSSLNNKETLEVNYVGKKFINKKTLHITTARLCNINYSVFVAQNKDSLINYPYITTSDHFFINEIWLDASKEYYSKRMSIPLDNFNGIFPEEKDCIVSVIPYIALLLPDNITLISGGMKLYDFVYRQPRTLAVTLKNSDAISKVTKPEIMIESICFSVNISRDGIIDNIMADSDNEYERKLFNPIGLNISYTEVGQDGILHKVKEFVRWNTIVSFNISKNSTDNKEENTPTDENETEPITPPAPTFPENGEGEVEL